MAGDHPIGADEAAAQQAGDHRLGHDTGADRRDRRVREGGHRAEYSDGSRAVPTAWTVRQPEPSRNEEPPGRGHLHVAEAGRRQGAGELVGRVVDLHDRELAAVVESTDGEVVGRFGMVGGAGRRIGQGVDARRKVRPA